MAGLASGAALTERASTAPEAGADVRAARLREARRLLGRATRASGSQRARGASVDGERALPVAAPLRSVFPGGGLRRGSTVAVRSSTSLLLALVAEASARGSWCALVGLPAVGLVAAEEAGLVLARVALVPRPGADLVAVVAALLDGVDLVAVAGVDRLRAGVRRRLAARARHRGSVLLPVGRWPGADLEVTSVAGRWHGPAGGGAGRLRCRQARVRVGGRGAAYRGRVVSALLPGPSGAVAGVDGPGMEAGGTRWPAERPGVTRAVGSAGAGRAVGFVGRAGGPLDKGGEAGGLVLAGETGGALGEAGGRMNLVAGPGELAAEVDGSLGPVSEAGVPGGEAGLGAVREAG